MIQEKRINENNKINRNKKLKKNIQIGAIALCACAFLGVNGYMYSQGLEATEQATDVVRSINEEHEKSIEALSSATEHIDDLNSEVEELQEENENLRQEVARLREVSRGSSRGTSVEVTAYTLSEASCGKGAGHPAYGRTATGMNLAGHTLESARAIAVDPKIIPLGSKVRLHFNDADMQRYNGIYTAVDTGGAISGNRIDLFAGEGAESLAMHIGRRTAKLEIL